MAKVFKGAYMSVEEATAEVEHLLTKNYSPSDIVVVTHRSNKGAIEGLTVANIDPVLNADNTNVDSGDPSMFLIGNDEDPLGTYDLDPDITERYNTTIQNGGYVILAEGTKQDLEEASNTYLEREPIKDKSNSSIPNVGDVQVETTSEEQATGQSRSSTTVDGIPVKKSDGDYGGHSDPNITNTPPTPGQDQENLQ
ncbi:MAG: general stress protein [Pisciglobus halotolerans]|nr:general stress protein [Pisciglobus halotolerans]